MRHAKDSNRTRQPPRGAAAGGRRALPRPDATALIVDGHAAFADLVGAMLVGRFGIASAAVACRAADAASHISTIAPGLVILNTDLPDASGLTLLPIISRSNPDAGVLVLARNEFLARIRHDPRFDSRRHALAEVSAGWRAISGQIASLLEAASGCAVMPRAENLLSPRELQVFTHIGRGRSSADIASLLGIGQQTVETHRKSVTKKLQATGAELVRLAVLHVADHYPPPRVADAAAST